MICPEELESGVPGIAIMDNDDFKEDTLTGTCTVTVIGTYFQMSMMLILITLCPSNHIAC